MDSLGRTDTYAGTLGDGTAGKSLALLMEGSGSLTLSGTNTFTGGTEIDQTATLIVTNVKPLADDTSLTVGPGATLLFGGTQDPPVGQGPAAGDNGGASSPIDAAPLVSSIQCADEPLVDADSVRFIVSFTKPVTGVTAANFALDSEGPAGTIAAVTGGGRYYTVTVSGISGSGTLGLTVLGDGTIVDWQGTPLADPVAALENQQYTIERDLFWGGGSGAWTDCNWAVGSFERSTAKMVPRQ